MKFKEYRAKLMEQKRLFPYLMFPYPYCPKCGYKGQIMLSLEETFCNNKNCEVEYFTHEIVEIPVVAP